MSVEIELKSRHCVPCEGGRPPLGEEKVRELLERVPGWELEGQEIARTFSFKNYYRAMAFVNAVAFIAHREDHHPSMKVKYKTCKVMYSTQAIGGLSENDFICAAKVDRLLSL